ncbi:MAG: protein translocase subunit SecF, partial [Thermoleophilaceae bacterium]
PDQLPIGPDKEPVRTGDYEPSGNCNELLAEYEEEPGPAKDYANGTECQEQLEALGPGGPPEGSRVIKVPEGVVVLQQERAPNQPEQIKRFTVLEDDSELSGEDIQNPEANTDPNTNAPLVTMEFTDEGREAFARVTKRIAQRGFDQATLNPGAPPDQFLQRFAITLDDQIVSLATIDFQENPEGIDGRTGAQIEGVGTFEQANDLAESLRIGALPIDLKLISETQVSASLGQQALDQGLLAGGAGMVLTILFLLVFYRVLGGVATVALLIYAVLLFALVKLIPITLTLPGIAGLVLTLAVAADANIVMYERIKEEVRGGRSIPAAISAGYAKALRTIIDANVVTIGVAFILFTLATAGVKGFAFTLGVGTLVSLFTAVLGTSAILGSMARSRLLRRPSALGAGPERVDFSRFDFMGKSRWFFSASGMILVVGALAIAGLGINFGIDFESGTQITAPLERPASVDEVRGALEPLGYGDATIQDVDDEDLGANVKQISVSQLEPPEVTEVRQALTEEFGVGDFSSSSIGPTFGEQIVRTALIAVVASLLLIALYIGFRFEAKFAIPVLIALAHDLLITAGVYALAERELTTATVAALLTIMGYSLYDTIIVFDRIRENVPRMPRATFSQIANRSMSEVLTRSLATSFTVLMPVGALLLFGGETLKDFAFALLVGVASGAYSSIFIATPVLVEWKEREQVY